MPPVRREIVLTDVTRMREDRICIAGVDDKGRCIRPVVPDSNLWEGFLTCFPDRRIRPFTRLDLCMLDPKPDPPHTEDWTFSPWASRFIRQLDRSEAMSLLRSILDPSVSAIFGAPIHHEEGWFVQQGEGSRSLGTVMPRAVTEVEVYTAADRGVRVRITFTDNEGAGYRLSVTDLTLLRWCSANLEQSDDPAHLRDRLRRSLQRPGTILRIGLARHWAKHPDRCHLQITGVYCP